MVFDTATKILILGGLGALLVSFAFAYALAQARLADPEADRHLLLQVHVVTLWEGFMLLGLVWAVQFSDLTSGWETLAASLLVAAGALQAAANTMAWRAGKTNLFAPPRGLNYKFATANAIFASIGLVILILGCVEAL